MNRILEAVGAASKLGGQETQALCGTGVRDTGKTPERTKLCREKGAESKLKAALKNLQKGAAMSLNKRSCGNNGFGYGAQTTACLLLKSQEHLGVFTWITPVLDIPPHQGFLEKNKTLKECLSVWHCGTLIAGTMFAFAVLV